MVPRGAKPKAKKKYVACRSGDLPLGKRMILDLDGKSVGLFNVEGSYFALHNRCPHTGGPLCLGPITGTAQPTTGRNFEYGREGSILRCAWHGWEFEIETGLSLVDPKIRARKYPVTVEDGEVIVHI